MKRILLALSLLTMALLLISCGAAGSGGDLTETEGRFLLSADGAALLVTEGGSPIVLSVEAGGEDPFAGLSNGDRIAVAHGGIQETYPAQTEAHTWELLEEGSMEDIPEETLTALEDLGWDFGRDIHEPAAEPQTVENPVNGYCGNTFTEVLLNGETYSFWGTDSVNLTDLVINLNYADGVCRCLPEFTVNTEFGGGYGVNLTEHYVRYGDHQCPITEEQAAEIRGILERNCPGDGYMQRPMDSDE